MRGNRNERIPLTCINCGHKFSKTIGWLEDNGDFLCPGGCGDLHDVGHIMGTINKTLKDGIKSLGKNIKNTNKGL